MRVKIVSCRGETNVKDVKQLIIDECLRLINTQCVGEALCVSTHARIHSACEYVCNSIRANCVIDTYLITVHVQCVPTIHDLLIKEGTVPGDPVFGPGDHCVGTLISTNYERYRDIKDKFIGTVFDVRPAEHRPKEYRIVVKFRMFNDSSIFNVEFMYRKIVLKINPMKQIRVQFIVSVVHDDDDNQLIDESMPDDRYVSFDKVIDIYDVDVEFESMGNMMKTLFMNEFQSPVAVTITGRDAPKDDKALSSSVQAFTNLFKVGPKNAKEIVVNLKYNGLVGIFLNPNEARVYADELKMYGNHVEIQKLRLESYDYLCKTYDFMCR